LDRVRRLGVRCGIEAMTLLSLRHSWATHAESAWGLSELQIQRVLRHTNTRTQKRYRHADLANLCVALGAVSFGDAPPAMTTSSNPGIVSARRIQRAAPVDHFRRPVRLRCQRTERPWTTASHSCC